MQLESNYRFYLRRAAQERTLAIRSVTDAARRRHEELAAQFSERAQEHQAAVA